MATSFREILLLPDFGMMMLWSGLLMAAGFYQLYRATQLVDNSVLTWGAIIGTKNRRLKYRYYVQGGIYPIIAFQTEDGHEVEFESKTSIDSLDASADRVPVRYHRHHPNQAEVDRFLSVWGRTIMFLGCSLLLPVVYVVLSLWGT